MNPWERSTAWTPGQIVLRAVVAFGTIGAVLASGPAGALPGPGFLAVLIATALAFAVYPESGVGTLAMLLALGWWAKVTGGELHPSVLVASGLLLAAHVAAIVVAYGPDDVPVDRELALLWLRRAMLVAVAAPVTWVLAVSVRGDVPSGGAWVFGLVAAALASVAAGMSLRSAA